MIAIGFNWRDLWVGVYVSKDRKTVFICPLPCVVIGIGPDAKTHALIARYNTAVDELNQEASKLPAIKKPARLPLPDLPGTEGAQIT